MIVVPTGQIRAAAACALTALVATGGPAYAGDKGKPNISVEADGPSAATVQGAQPTHHSSTAASLHGHRVHQR